MTSPPTDYAALSAAQLAMKIREGWDYESKGLTAQQSEMLTALVSRVAVLEAERDEARVERAEAVKRGTEWMESQREWKALAERIDAARVRAETALRELAEAVAGDEGWNSLRGPTQSKVYDALPEAGRYLSDTEWSDVPTEVLDRLHAVAEAAQHLERVTGTARSSNVARVGWERLRSALAIWEELGPPGLTSPPYGGGDVRAKPASIGGPRTTLPCPAPGLPSTQKEK